MLIYMHTMLTGRRHTGYNDYLLTHWDQVMHFWATATERAPFSMSRGLVHSWDEGVRSPASERNPKKGTWLIFVWRPAQQDLTEVDWDNNGQYGLKNVTEDWSCVLISTDCRCIYRTSVLVMHEATINQIVRMKIEGYGVSKGKSLYHETECLVTCVWVRQEARG